MTTPSADFYINPVTTPTTGAFHTPAYLPTPNLLPFSPTDLTKLPFDNPSIRSIPPSPMEQLSLHLSPASSRHSSSPQMISGSMDTRDQRIHSTLDHSNSEQSEDEDIDVVKSAFQPIKSISTIPEVQHPDSTVQDKEIIVTKCELKAPTIKKSLSLLSSKSPTSTRLHNSTTISAQKAVWRPY